VLDSVVRLSPLIYVQRKGRAMDTSHSPVDSLVKLDLGRICFLCLPSEVRARGASREFRTTRPCWHKHLTIVFMNTCLFYW
jgi:hypothetical protein